MDTYYYNGDDGKPYTLKGHTNLGMDMRDILISIKGLLRFFVTHDNGFTYVWPRQVIMEWWVPREG